VENNETWNLNNSNTIRNSF